VGRQAGGTAAHDLSWYDNRMISHMRTRCPVVALLLVPCSILVAACAAPVEPETDTLGELAERWPATSGVQDAEPTGEAQQELPIVSFSRSDFPFVTIVEDDGTGKAGGWQLARPSLSFTHVVFPTRISRWQCTFTLEMPIRTEKMGRFSPRRAADVSAKIANDVGRRMDYKLPEGIFCTTFISNMDKTFKSPPYNKIGASVHR
jgi:hypothetical protein